MTFISTEMQENWDLVPPSLGPLARLAFQTSISKLKLSGHRTLSFLFCTSHSVLVVFSFLSKKKLCLLSLFFGGGFVLRESVFEYDLLNCLMQSFSRLKRFASGPCLSLFTLLPSRSLSSQSNRQHYCHKYFSFFSFTFFFFFFTGTIKTIRRTYDLLSHSCGPCSPVQTWVAHYSAFLSLWGLDGFTSLQCEKLKEVAGSLGDTSSEVTETQAGRQTDVRGQNMW